MNNDKTWFNRGVLSGFSFMRMPCSLKRVTYSTETEAIIADVSVTIETNDAIETAKVRKTLQGDDWHDMN